MKAVALLQTKMQRNRVLNSMIKYTIKSSRWGLFVTDGDKRVSLSRDTVAADVTLADALEALSKSASRSRKTTTKKKSTKTTSRRSSTSSRAASTPAAVPQRRKPTIKLKRNK